MRGVSASQAKWVQRQPNPAIIGFARGAVKLWPRFRLPQADRQGRIAGIAAAAGARLIDQVVYRLYGLSKAVIAVVEGRV